MGFDKSGLINNALTKTKSLLGNPVASASVGAAVGGVGGYLVGRKTSRSVSRRKKSRNKSSKKKSRNRRKNKHRSGPRGKLTHHKHRRGAHKGIHYTKKGQPYIIMASGKARFIKKSGAKRSRKLKGGRY